MRDRQLIAALLAGAALLTACEASDRQPEHPANTSVAPGTNTTAPAPTPSPTPTPTAAEAGKTLPPADAQLRYVGLWAADAASCAARAWEWGEHRLETPAHTVCEFSEIEAVPGGYDIAARCTAEAPPADDQIKVRFAESAKAMMVEAKTFSPVGLVYCGPLNAG